MRMNAMAAGAPAPVRPTAQSQPAQPQAKVPATRSGLNVEYAPELERFMGALAGTLPTSLRPDVPGTLTLSVGDKANQVLQTLTSPIGSTTVNWGKAEAVLINPFASAQKTAAEVTQIAIAGAEKAARLLNVQA